MRLLSTTFLLACSSGTVQPKFEEITPVVDQDNDGYTTENGDCNDEDPTIYTGAMELCDGIDNNCDGQIDEGVLDIFYADEDNDGFGNANLTTEGCETPQGYVSNGSDCDDSDNTSYPSAEEMCDGVDNNCDGTVDEDVTEIWYADADLDGYGNIENSLESCLPDEGYVANPDDCDDNNEMINPAADEICDGLDNNCDEAIDEDLTITVFVDLDADGFGNENVTEETCEAGEFQSLIAGDCDDIDSNINPNADELCDFIDNNCNGTVDEETALDSQIWYEDADGDGDGNPLQQQTNCYQPTGYVASNTDCDDTDITIYTNAPELCDGIVNSCGASLATDESDDDGDGYVECSIDLTGWDGSTLVIGGNDCDDNNANYYTLSTYYRDLDIDGFGDIGFPLSICVPPSDYVVSSTDCDDTDSNVYPGAVERCDGQVNNCGTTLAANEEDNDADGYVECTIDSNGWHGSNLVVGGEDCDDGEDTIFPGAPERCDGQVNNCGTTLAANEEDNDADGYVECTIDSNGWHGSNLVVGGEDCNDAIDNIHPNAVESCDDMDSNCDGSLIDGFPNFDGDTEPDCVDEDDDNDGFVDTDDCDDNDSTIYPGALDICENGIDEDCSGLDESCIIQPWEQSGSYYMLTKPDATFYSGADCNGNFFGANQTTVNGVPFAVGPHTNGGRMAGLPPGGPSIYTHSQSALVNHAYAIFPGGRCSSQPLYATFYYSDGSSYSTGQLSIPHDCTYSSSISSTNARAVYQGNYGGPCCAYWYWGEFTNPSPNTPVDSISIYYSDGCGGTYNGQIWSVTVD